MVDVTKQILSGSTNGLQILVVATATAGTLIHTADATAKDEIWIWADNSDGTDRLLTIEWGGVSDPANIIEVTIPALGTAATDGPALIIPGWILTNSLVVRAFASAASVIKINGHVNRIT